MHIRKIGNVYLNINMYRNTVNGNDLFIFESSQKTSYLGEMFPPGL